MPDYKELVKNKKSTKKVNQAKVKTKHRLPKHSGKALLLLIFIALIAGLGYFGYSTLVRFPGFILKQATVIDQNGKAVASPEDYFKMGTYGELNLFGFNMRQVSQDIQARHPELTAVIIRKQFPDQLVISIVEREPLAIISLRELYLVDKEAFILPFKDLDLDLPKIVGIHPRQIKLYANSQSLRLKRALELLDHLQAAKIYPENKIAEINVKRYSEVFFYLASGIEVKMGQGNFAQKAGLLGDVLSELKLTNSIPKYIDMRFDHPIVKP
ncbi:cell division protein FtsQ/DivIB [Candidatus Omnitrophota bacterium]